MLTYKGKYNSANVMTDVVESELVAQIYSFLNHPALEKGYIAVMPDCHWGNGTCIGFTKQMNEYIIPNMVGVDIGCGIESYNLGKIDINFYELDHFIRENIPSGFNIRSKEIDNLGLYKSLINDIEDTCDLMSLDFAKVLKAIGTLGGGNHFIELDKAPNGNIWLTLHTGSRNFGLQVCNYHQKKAKELMNQMFIGDAYKGLEFLPLEFGGKEYLKHMHFAQQYAELNRHYIATRIIDFLKVPEVIWNIKTVHNYINFSDNIIRKGAISAKLHEEVLIPLNMKDGVIVGKGKGNAKWNFSAPHGAGRVLSRSKAKAQITLEQMKSDMEGIYSNSLSKDTIDESPSAYKDSQFIIDAIGETVHINFVMKPIYNFKAGEK